MTHVKRGGFYGWPYFYMGAHADTRLNGAHPELKRKVLSDVLRWHAFPAEYRGELFAAEHGFWNRAVRAGHEAGLPA